jgi:signal transduction histidine kinase
MDPTTAIPLHFTLQALAIAATGLVLAWAVVRKEWFGALGALSFGFAEGLHAGRFIADDNEPALLALRLAGLALLSFAAARAGRRLPMFAGAVAAVVAGTAWAAAVGGGIADLSVGPHVLVAVGSLLLGLWAWLASRDSIRLRVLTALVGMLAIVVVAGGGAVSRVAALDKRNEQVRQLGSAATAIGAVLTDSVTDLNRRATLLAPLAAPNMNSDDALTSTVVSAHQGADVETIAVVDRSGVRAQVTAGSPDSAAYSREQLRTSPTVQTALSGRVSSAYDVSSGRLVLIVAAPVAALDRSGTLGAVAIVQSRTPAALKAAAREYAPDAEIVILGRTTGATDSSLATIQPQGVATSEVVFERVRARDGTRPAAVAPVGSRDVRVVVVGSDVGTVEASTGLLRALLVAILAAAVFAAASALWLSARVTRPILDLAEGAERAKTDFLSSLSHELRTPLTPIRGYTELLRKGRVPPRRAADYLDEIGDAAGRLERIVMLLLDVAAQEAGRFHVEAEDTKPDEVLDEAAARWKHRGRQHPVTVSSTRSLPRVHADPNALARVLDELIDNAIKFSPGGGEIELRARKTKDGVEISVADSGIGISPEQVTELMRAFTQADSGDRRRYGGLGLGLAYVSGALAAHDSTLAVRSEPDGGTIFSFTLPTASMVSRMPARAAQQGPGEAAR